MPVTGKASVEDRLGFLRAASVRLGIFAGVALSVVSIGWVVIANRVPSLAGLATERNMVAVVLLAICAAAPAIRFLRSPAELLQSGLLAWGIFTLTYRVLCSIFVRLDENYSTFHVFVMGAICYLVLATLSWVGTIVWRVRATDHSQLNH